MCSKLHAIILILCEIHLLFGFDECLFQNHDSRGSKSEKPNIIIILGDDLVFFISLVQLFYLNWFYMRIFIWIQGFNDVSIHGADQILTPNIDALGINGIQLNEMYVLPLCTPSRTSLLTGKYASSIGMQNVIGGAQPYGLSLNEKTMADYMKDAGYDTHMIGKWHLGFFEQKYTPTFRGFDSFFGYYNGALDYYNHSFSQVTKSFLSQR